MKKGKTQNNTIYEIDDFQHHCHLWNIVPSGQGKGIVLLRKIVDAIQNNNYSRPYNKIPSFLITGEEGKGLVARALVNSLQIEDIRECPSCYLENGISSHQFFSDSITNTAHIITHIEHLNKVAESVVWRYLAQGRCTYSNFFTKKIDSIIHCNGLIVLTTKNKDVLSSSIIKAIDNIVELERFSNEQLKLIVHQRLKFIGMEYDGEGILQEIVGKDPLGIGEVMQFLKKCVMLMHAENWDCLTYEIVEKAVRLSSLSVEPPPSPPDDDIPF